MDYLLDIFYIYIYEPIYYTFEKYFYDDYTEYNNYMFLENISEYEINKLLNEVTTEIKHDNEMKELQMRYIELTKDDVSENCINIDPNDDSDDDDNENALIVKKIPVSL